MRAIRAIGAAFLMASALLPATSHADGPPGVAAAAPPAAARCPCPGVQHRRVWHHVWRRHWRHARVVVAPVAPYPPPVDSYYNVPLPPTFDGDYSRMMAERARYFWLVANGPVYDYDIMANAYIPLARGDAERVLAVVGLPR